MAFSKTIPQMRDRSKTVTRRVGWASLAPGTRLLAIEKGQGLKKGERVVPLGVIEVVDVRQEPLELLLLDERYALVEVALEGFPGRAPADFVALFGTDPALLVTRIKFRHVEEESHGQ